MTDSSADLPWSYYTEHNIPFLPFNVNLDGGSYLDDGTVSAETFFSKLRGGLAATTSQITPEQFKAAMEPLLKDLLRKVKG